MRRRAAAILGVAAVLAGCTVGSTGNAVAPTPTVVPSRTNPPAASATPSRTPATPPGATLTAGGSSAPGTLGTWTVRGAGSDSPWLPAAAVVALTAGTRDRLAVRFDDGTEIGAWEARTATVDDTAGLRATTVAGRTAAAPPVAAIDLPPLPPGRWVLQVRLDLADGAGQAFYSWAVLAR